MRRVALVALLGVALGACGTDLGEEDRAPVFMRITQVLGQRGANTPGQFSAFLASDVITLVTAGQNRVPTIFTDAAQLTIQVTPKNPNLATSATSSVTLERYEVRYLRSDGRNVEGVDVPYRISGPMAFTVPMNATGNAVIEVVRAQAKREPPLLNLASGTGEDIISCTAEITVHGRTAAGQAVTDMGRLQIDFANWGDPQ